MCEFLFNIMDRDPLVLITISFFLGGGLCVYVLEAVDKQSLDSSEDGSLLLTRLPNFVRIKKKSAVNEKFEKNRLLSRFY